MSFRMKIFIGVLIAFNLYQGWLVRWWSKWALEQSDATLKKLFDVPEEQTYEYWLAQEKSK